MNHLLELRLRQEADRLAAGTRPMPLRDLRTRARRRRVVAFTAPTVGLLLLVGAVAVATDGPERRLTTTATTTATVTKKLAATSEVAGVRVTLRLDRGAVRVGQVVSAVATVVNTRPSAVHFSGGSCQAPDSQPTVGVDLRPGQPLGRSWTGAAGQYKERALASGPGGYRFTADGSGSQFCLEYLRSWQLAPGQTLSSAVRWRARTPLGYAYDGTGRVRASFAFAARPGQDERQVVAEVPLRVTGGENHVVSPAEAVDVALADPGFHSLVERYPPGTRGAAPSRTPPLVQEWPWYVAPASGRRVYQTVWRLWLVRNGMEQYGFLSVDPDTGRILERSLPAAGS